MVRIDKDEALEALEREADAAAAFGGCVMCRLANARNAHAWIRESEHGVVVLDAYGASEGHLLIVAKAHLERTTQLDWDLFADLQRLAFEANRVLETELSPERIYTATLGASQQLPMSFPHFHIHVVPVFVTDERARPAHVFSWSSGVVRYETEEAQRLSARLAGAWQIEHGTARRNGSQHAASGGNERGAAGR